MNLRSWNIARRDYIKGVAGGKQAVRAGLNTTPDPSVELYDLEHDPSEKLDAADSMKEIARDFLGIFNSARTDSPDFPLFKS